MKTHRHMRDKAVLRALLAEPIRSGKSLSDGLARLMAEKQQVDDRIEALFALYDVPEEWPVIDQWERLARSAAR